MLRERWPPWKAGLYGSEVVSSQGHCFWTGGLVCDNDTWKDVKGSGRIMSYNV